MRKMTATTEVSKFFVSVFSTDDGFDLDGYFEQQEEVSEGVYEMVKSLVDRIKTLEREPKQD